MNCGFQYRHKYSTKGNDGRISQHIGRIYHSGEILEFLLPHSLDKAKLGLSKSSISKFEMVRSYLVAILTKKSSLSGFVM